MVDPLTGVTKVVVCTILSGMVHIKELKNVVHMSGSSGFLLAEWSFTICLTYNRK